MAELPIVIAHRGASGYLPEHTLVGKAYAHALGADYLEQDVVLTGDGVPIVLHDTWLDDVTDVASVFPGRQRDDGRSYAIDFSLEEIRRLSIQERRDRSGRRRWPRRFDGPGQHLRIATLAEEIAFIQGLNRSTGRTAGVYPEIKNPAWHRQHGQDISRKVLDVLERFGLDRRSDALFLQCFDAEELQRVRVELGRDLRLIQLLGDESWLGAPEAGLDRIATYADGIGVSFPYLFHERLPARTATESGLTRAAHARGLLVHAYTYRDDDLPPGVSGAAEAHRLLYEVAAIDGLFSDHPDVSLACRPSLAAGPAVP